MSLHWVTQMKGGSGVHFTDSSKYHATLQLKCCQYIFFC